MALVTAAQVRAAGIPEVSGTGIDSTLTTMIAQCDAVFASWCDYPLAASATEHTMESASYVLYLDGLEEDQRILPQPFTRGRATSITSVYDDPDRDFTGSAVASSDYALRADSGDILLKSTSTQGAWSTIDGSVKLTIVAGWADTAAPDDIKRAACMYVAHWWRLRGEHGRDSLSADGVSVQLVAPTIPDDVAQILAPWRLVRWPS